ncbi:hypothetical protein NKH93_22070 [Mesorhizobium sp. M0954]
MAQEKYRIGVDVGGTFTDLSLANELTGELHHFKTPRRLTIRRRRSKMD